MIKAKECREAVLKMGHKTPPKPTLGFKARNSQHAIFIRVPVSFCGVSRPGSPHKYNVRGFEAYHKNKGRLMAIGGKPEKFESIRLRFWEYPPLTSDGTPMFRGEDLNEFRNECVLRSGEHPPASHADGPLARGK